MLKRISSYELVRYCRANSLCSGQTLRQWNRMQHYADSSYELPEYFIVLATMIYFCSETTMSIREIAKELESMSEEVF